jgi:aminoglycoside phosphotransferase (APT) family kinase protein
VSVDLAGLPAAPVTRWLRTTLPDLVDSGPWQAEVISGGLSNITYRLRFPVRRSSCGALRSAHCCRVRTT